MNNKLFVGNLPYSATEAELRDAFAECGTVVSVKIITDRESGRSKGFGFVEMQSDAEATAAIEKLNGADYSGRAITVSVAKAPGEGGGGRGPRPGGGGGRGFGGPRGGDRGPRG